MRLGVACFFLCVIVASAATACAKPPCKQEPSGFVAALAEHPDYSKGTMAKASRILQRETMLDPHTQGAWEALLEEVMLIIVQASSDHCVLKLHA